MKVGLWLMLLLMSTSLLAQELNDRDSDWGGTPDTYEGPWREVGASDLPPAPNPDDLRRIISTNLEDSYTYQLDRESIAVFRDNTFRYTVVIETAGGTSNIFYEALRCETREYKTFAFLSGEDFRLATSAKWQPIRKSGLTIYRQVLLDEYVCPQSRIPANKDAVVAKLDEYHKRMGRAVLASPRETETGPGKDD